jgi:aminoglycoside 6'-N-acetyltransferase
MEIKFLPLHSAHFSLLLEWLNADHVRKWWDQDIAWTPELITEKYTSYTQGLKDQKPIYAYVFSEDEVPIGYIQYYNIRDFPRDTALPDDMRDKSSALDFYIGDPNYLHKGYGRATLKTFCEEIVWEGCDACFVDPDPKNEAAIKAYESAGFEMFKETENVVWMVKCRL